MLMGLTGHSNLVDSDGTILFCSLYQLTAHKVTPVLLQLISNNTGGWFLGDEDTHQFKDAIVGYSPVDLALENIHPESLGGKQWVVFSTQDPDETNEPLHHYRLVALGFGLGLTIIITILAILGYRAILDAQARYDNERSKIAQSDSIRQLLQSYHQISITSLEELETIIDAHAEVDGSKDAIKVNKIRRGLSTVGSALSHLSYFAGGGMLSCEPIDLRKLIVDTISLMDHLVARKNINILKEEEEAPLTINGDTRLLRLVVMNLLLNAIQSIQSTAGTIVIATGVDRSDNAYITVTDNGEGISPDQIEKIFDPFYSTRKGASQRGLGLAASMGVIDAHEGSICITSKIGQGTMVTVTLPMPITTTSAA
jgi:signal transduction histidine kinase